MLKQSQQWLLSEGKSLGFWKNEEGLSEQEIAEAAIAHVREELEEACVELKEHGTQEIYFGPDGKPEGFAVEVFDMIAIALSLMEVLGHDMNRIGELKTAYNRKRTYENKRIRRFE